MWFCFFFFCRQQWLSRSSLLFFEAHRERRRRPCLPSLLVLLWPIQSPRFPSRRAVGLGRRGPEGRVLLLLPPSSCFEAAATPFLLSSTMHLSSPFAVDPAAAAAATVRLVAPPFSSCFYYFPRLWRRFVCGASAIAVASAVVFLHDSSAAGRGPWLPGCSLSFIGVFLFLPPPSRSC